MLVEQGVRSAESEALAQAITAAKKGEPTVVQLDRILDLHAHDLEQMAVLEETSPALFEALAVRAEERCIFLKRPLMHRRKRWYAPIPEPLSEPQETIAGYSILYPLHEGSLGSRTLVALHPEGFLCLVKIYHPSEFDLEPQAMFRHQERMIQRLNRFEEPRLEEVLDHFLMEDGRYIQIKPFLRCCTLSRWMELHPTREKRIRFLQAAAEVIDRLHEGGIAHMDLKPEQFLILPDPEDGSFADPPEFVLIDYDFSMIDGELTLSVGSAPYYAPEQFERRAPRGHQAGVRADTYAFCVLIHRLLAETFPFGDGRTEPTMLDEYKQRRIFTSLSIPHKPLRKVLQAGLHPTPRKRPPFRDILKALKDPTLLEQSHLFPTTRPSARLRREAGAPPGERMEPISYKGRVLVATGMIGVIAVVGYLLMERGILSRTSPLLLALFLFGVVAFLTILFRRD